MTNEESIKYLKQLYPNGGHCWLDEQRIEAIGMAIKALQKEPASEDLEEATKRYATEGDEISGLHIIDEEVDAFIAGAKWQKQQILDCNTTLQRTFELGKQEMKQQLMAKAVDGVAMPNDGEIWVDCLSDLPSFYEGEEVKVIILKKDGYE